MSIFDAYCIQLKRVVTITEARTEFLNDPKFNRFDFLCSTPSCRENKVKIVGTNYRIHPSTDHRNKAHFRKYPAKINEHCEDCYLHYDENVRIPGESEDEFKLRKVRSNLDDYVDEFKLSEENEAITSSSKSSLAKDEKHQPPSSTSNKSKSNAVRYSKTNQLMRLVESYLDSRNKLKNDVFKTLPLKVEGQDIKYLYQYFYTIKKGIEKEKHCVYMGDVILKRMDKGLFFQFTETVWEMESLKMLLSFLFSYKLLKIRWIIIAIDEL